MAAYNGEKYIEEQIASILNQTSKNWKLFISDDGSRDSTVHIIESYRDRYPDKIFIIEKNQENVGSKDRFEYLLKASDAYYFMFCDQDDVWIPGKVEVTYSRMLALENKHGKNVPLLVHTDLKVVDSDLNIVSESFAKYQNINPVKIKTLNRLLIQNVITGCTVMINRALKEICIPIPERAIMHDWWIGLVASSTGVVDYINIPTVLYRQHPDNAIGAKKWGLKYIFNSIKVFHKKAESLRDTICQAKDFLSNYRTKLDLKNLKITEAYAGLDQNSFIKKRYKIVRYNFYRRGLLNNIGVFLRV